LSEVLELGTVDATEIGLVWDADNRLLSDPETGEIVRLEKVVDEATAKAASYRIWATEAGIEILKAQKRSIDRQIKQRKARLDVFRSLYLDDMVSVAKTMMEKAKKRGQSIKIGFGVVGWRQSSRKIEFGDFNSALAYTQVNAPEALKATIDLANVSERRRAAISAILVNLAATEEGCEVSIDTDRIPESLVRALPVDAFLVTEGGKPTWYIKGDRPKGGDDVED